MNNPAKARKKDEPFAKVPLEWLARMIEVGGRSRAVVYVWLAHLAWKAKGPTFELSNFRLKHYGVSREIKRKTLLDLEMGGMIVVERRSRKTPVVTLVDWPYA